LRLVPECAAWLRGEHVVRPILGWLHCGVTVDVVGGSPDSRHPADPGHARSVTLSLAVS
jgi:hypothetical protein